MSGPYIVTTKRMTPPAAGTDDWPILLPLSRVAVATLEEARDEARKHGLVAVPEWGCTDTLPDGTVVEVEAADVGDLWKASGLTHLFGSSSKSPSLQDIIDAFNAKGNA